MKNTQSRYHREGYEAFSTPQRECPYPIGSAARMMWIEGITDAQEDHERELPDTKVIVSSPCEDVTSGN